jgi:hypothetical protein
MIQVVWHARKDVLFDNLRQVSKLSFPFEIYIKELSRNDAFGPRLDKKINIDHEAVNNIIKHVGKWL